ncbi:MAG: GAF domain-containing protein [Gemmatimonadota bacterium]
MDCAESYLGKPGLAREVLAALAPLYGLDEIAERLGEVLTPRYRLSFCGFSLWDEKRRLFIERVSIPKEAEPQHIGIEDLDDYGFGIAVKRNAPRLVRDIEEEGLRAGEWRARERFGTRSYLTIPIHVRSRVAGAFGLGSPVSGAFRDKDVDFLQPVAIVLGMKAGELGLAPPLDLGGQTSVLPGPVLLTGTDESLKQRVVDALPPAIRVRRDGAPAGDAGAGTPTLTIYVTRRLGRQEARRIVSMLQVLPRRMVVVYREGQPDVAFRLAREASAYGLLSIESDSVGTTEGLTGESLGIRLTRWVLSDAVQPDWKALGVSPGHVNARFLRVLRILEGDPLGNWKVKHLAREAGMSVATLLRVVRDGAGRPPRTFLRDLRFHVLDRFLRSGELPGSHVYPLFHFSSAVKMKEWHDRYQAFRGSGIGPSRS